MEQQQHLIELFSQRQTILNEIESLKNNSSQKRDLLLRVEGAIEYLTSIGVTLPEPEAESETEVVENTEENEESEG